MRLQPLVFLFRSVRINVTIIVSTLCGHKWRKCRSRYPQRASQNWWMFWYQPERTCGWGPVAGSTSPLTVVYYYYLRKCRMLQNLIYLCTVLVSLDAATWPVGEQRFSAGFRKQDERHLEKKSILIKLSNKEKKSCYQWYYSQLWWTCRNLNKPQTSCCTLLSFLAMIPSYKFLWSSGFTPVNLKSLRLHTSTSKKTLAKVRTQNSR